MGLLNNIFKNNDEDKQNDDKHVLTFESESKRHYPSHVFISYSSKDKETADAVCHYLEENGINSWIAPRNISSGENFAGQISDAVNSAFLVVLIASSNSFESLYVKNEISLAYENDKYIIPFKIDESLPHDEMNFFLQSPHWIEAYPNPVVMFDKLLDSINEIYDINVVGSEIVQEDFDVYISYSTRDKETADAVCHYLEENGVRCWIAPRNLLGGVEYSRQIFEAINKVNIYLLIASINSYESQFVEGELDTAYNCNKHIISLNIDNQMPQDNFLYYLKNAHWLQLNGHSEKMFEKLLQDVNILNSSEVSDNSYHAEDNNEIIGDSIALKRPFDAYVGDDPYIFVSYAHKDSDIIFEEIKKFHYAGYPIWYDQALTAGREWDEEIEDALLGCSLMVVFISENSMASNNVVDEIKLALEEKINIVPIYLEEAKLAKGLKLRLSQKHAIFKFRSDEEDYLEECFKAFDSANIPKH